MPAELKLAPRDYETVMVSRSFSEWEEYRVELIKSIQSIGLKVAVLGHYELTAAGVIEASLKLVQSSGALAIIIGEKYGFIPDEPRYNPQQLSLTELEFDQAISLDKPVLAFTTAKRAALTDDMPHDDLESIKKLDAFRQKVEANGPLYYFVTLDDFRALAGNALTNLSGPLKFRAGVEKRRKGQSAASSAASSRNVSVPDSSIVRDDSLTGATEKPLVFISASHKDIEWRQLLEKALDNYKDYVEWWDDSLLEPGTTWEAEIESMRARAKVTVLLLSPDYLSSRNAIAEMAILSAQSRSAGLRLMPIVVRDCDWQDVPEIRAVQVWDNGRPIERLPDQELLTDEFRKIANSILKLLGKAPAVPQAPAGPRISVRSPSMSAELNFSPDAQRVWDKAQSLANATGRFRVTSSCLLFGFAEAATSDRNGARFVRDLLEKTGRYEEALKTFLEDGPERVGDRVSEPLVGDTSLSVAAVLDYAKVVRSTISPGSTTIDQQHLLAALLNLPGRKGKLRAHKRMKEIGIERSQYIAEFFAFIRTVAPQETASWRKLLRLPPDDADQPPKKSSPFVSGPAGYTAEFCGVGGERPVADYLFVSAHADRLAELIALKETKLPLAIGLFGNWGSGKSHFMNLMDRRLKALTKQEKERGSNSKQEWCREIVPIYFNAWHYLDMNLWASLVSQIFESLFAHLRPKQDDLAAVQKLLEEASGATARAAEEVGLAQAAAEQAKIDLSIAEENRRREQTVVDALLRGLRQLLPHISLDEVQQQVVDVLGDRRAVNTLNDLRGVSKDARTFGSRVKRSWNNLFKQPGRAWRITWLVVTLLIIPGLAIVAATYLPVVKDWFGGFARRVTAIIATLAPVIGWIGYILKKGNEQLDRIDVWIAQAKAEQERANETPQVLEARMNVTAAVAREEAARSRLARAEAREQQLIEEARGLHPERRLGRYIEQRAQSSDYRGQLGLVSLARRDFQELSNLFADAEALYKRTADLEKEQTSMEARAAELRNSIAGAEKEEAQEIEEQAVQLEKLAKELEEQGKRIEELSASIDRIVLFVDDLDRCQPEKIVEVLQAVHLLLAFPLFAVVVGVDQRALRHSLRTQFKGLLAQDAPGSGSDKNGDQRTATPLDYLEKIFHVPFHLPTMGKDGFVELISNLTEPSVAETKPPAEIAATRPATVEVATVPRSQTIQVPSIPDPGSVANQNASLRPGAITVSDPVAIKNEPSAPQTVTVQDVNEKLVGSVPLQNWEREALRDYHTLIKTPRGAKRLLNTYRLVRAGVPKQEWDSFSAGEYRVAMLLLAAAAGYPATVREWFGELLRDDTGKLLTREDSLATDTLGWNKFKSMYESLPNDTKTLTKDAIAKWIQRVETFTF